MNRPTSALVYFAALPRKIFNKILNIIASAFSSSPVIIDWVDARIINPKRIRFLGSFAAGRGLWLEAVGADSEIHIGGGAKLSDWVHIGAVGKISIGADALIGSKVVIIDHSHGHGYGKRPEEIGTAPADRPLVARGSIVIGKNVWLGDNVVVLSGVLIGDNCIVGANSLVRTDLPSNSVCAGNPAKVLLRIA